MNKTKIITAAEMAEHYKPLGDLYLAYKRIEKLEADNARLREALGEVWDWIGNWSPDFIWDDEWPATEAKARAALAKRGLEVREIEG